MEIMHFLFFSALASTTACCTSPQVGAARQLTGNEWVASRLAWQAGVKKRLECCTELDEGAGVSVLAVDSDAVATRGWRDACLQNLSSLGSISLVAQDRESRPLDVLHHNATDEWVARWLPTAREPFPAGEIPPRLHQTYAGCRLSKWQRAWQASCGKHNANWELLQWTDAANRALVARDFPAFLPTYDAYDATIKRVDAIRYLLLYRFGGVYMDLDFACLRSFDALPSLLPAGRVVLGVGMPPDVLNSTGRSGRVHRSHPWSNAFMAAPPRHPFFAFVIRRLISAARHRSVLRATGPRMLSAAIRTWQRAHADGGGLTLHPFGTIYNHDGLRRSAHPCGSGAPSELPECARRFPRSFATTFWTASWIRRPASNASK